MNESMKRNECTFLAPANCSLRNCSEVLTGSVFCSVNKIARRKQSVYKRKVVAPLKRCTIVATSSRGFGGFLSKSASNDSNFIDSLPSPDATCACGTDKPYGKCCRRFHTAQSLPQLCDELLRSRYSAYAYRLPTYIMKTTHTSMAELDRRKWKREILDFCKDYQFIGGVDIIEQQMTGPYSTRILFR